MSNTSVESKKADSIESTLPSGLIPVVQSLTSKLNRLIEETKEETKALSDFYELIHNRLSELESERSILFNTQREIRNKIISRLKSEKKDLVRVDTYIDRSEFENPPENGLTLVFKRVKTLSPVPESIEKMIRNYYRKYKNGSPLEMQDKIDRVLQRHFKTDKTIFWGIEGGKVVCTLKPSEKEFFDLESDEEWNKTNNRIKEIEKEKADNEKKSQETYNILRKFYSDIFFSANRAFTTWWL